MRMLLIILGILCTTFGLNAQSVRDVSATPIPGTDKVTVGYTLADTLPSRLFRVTIVAATPEGLIPLTALEGTFGDSIPTGTHTATWDAYADWGRFDGEVRIQVQAVPMFRFELPRKRVSVKRDEPIYFAWYGDNSSLDELRVELYQYDKRVDTLTLLVNKANFTWQVPTDLKPGNGYRIRLVGTPLSGIDAYSREFTIQRKVPLAYLYAGGGVLAAGIVGLIVLLNERIDNPPDPNTIDGR